MSSLVNKLNFKLLLFLFLNIISYNVIADLCRTPNFLLTLTNRPSFAESPCTVPPNKIYIESGFQYQTLETGMQVNAPEFTGRLGITDNSEFVINLSNYIYQTHFPNSGITATWMGIKHRIYSTKKWLITGEGFFSPPSGDKYFGSSHSQASISGMVFNKFSSTISWQLQTGINTLSDPQINGGHQFKSINTMVLASYTVQKISSFIEFFTQTKTMSNQSFELIGGGGIIFLYNSKTTFDMSFYHRFRGQGFDQLGGIGFTRLF